jgi:hypothetical protein
MKPELKFGPTYAGDAIQLASAIWLRQGLEVSRLLAFGTPLATAAAAEGFSTEL